MLEVAREKEVRVVNRRSLVFLVLIAGVAFWLFRSGKLGKGTVPAGSSGGSSSTEGAVPGAAGFACLSAAEEAGRETQEAATVLLRAPVDPAAFSTASERATSKISAAEGKCGGGGTASEERAMAEARGALAEMRALLSDVSSTLSGGGSASELPRRREAVDVKLAAARAALQG